MIGQKDAYLSEMAARIRGLLAPYKSFRQASEVLDIPEATLARLARGANDPTSETLLRLASKLNVSVSYLIGVSDEPRQHLGSAQPHLELKRVPSLDARVAAGSGQVNHAVAVEQMLAFPVWMLQRLAPPGAKLAFMRAHGDSMLPLFADGALLLINENDNELPDHPPRPKSEFDAPDLYVLLQDDVLRVKRLRKIGRGELLLLSENRAYGPEVLRGPDLKRCKIIGRVIWWDSRL
ncbi:MAG TPA: S24 family peptidase [Methylocystis sp.]|jgi:transcriptional regulator with XRE-family HTH domain